MKMKKLMKLFIIATMAFVLNGCGKEEKPADSKENTIEESSGEKTGQEKPAEQPEQLESPEPEDLVIDTEKKEVALTATVNSKYFNESTRHAVSFKDGSNGPSALLCADADNVDFYDALIKIGAQGGDNVSLDDMGAAVADDIRNEGDKLEVLVAWDDYEGVPLEDIIKADKPAEFDIRFAGNKEAAISTGAGCVLCLDSCGAGITTNAAYPVGTTQSGEMEFFGNEDILPEDGTQVTVIFRLVQ